MCQEARISADDKVLEIGTGSGYGAAVLSLLAREVHTIERIEELFEAARARLARLGYKNVQIHWDDGTLGLPSEAPFNAIIVTAGAVSIPGAYQAQLADGGRLIMPVGPPSHQQMIRLSRRGDTFERDNLGSFGFVPLVADEAGH
jgi:protein-L-isoaspartate(D-aspartate) O-methyltransferase